MCDDLAMLRSVEISAALGGTMRGDGFHNLHWQRKIELTLDCFVCERTDRTTSLEWGAERAVCSSDTEHGSHFTAARIAAFDYTSEAEQLILHTRVDYWWAPFQDAKRNRPALPIGSAPWVRLHMGYYCPEHRQGGECSTQTNLVRPVTTRCRYCEAAVAVSMESPVIRLLV
jgi:hypothetical protein